MKLNPAKLERAIYNTVRKALRNPMPRGAVCSLGGKKSKKPSNRIEYHGAMNSEALRKFAARESEDGSYIVYTVIFGEPWVYKTDTLPSSVYSPSDYPHGYFHNGHHFDWSDSRKYAMQKAMSSQD